MSSPNWQLENLSRLAESGAVSARQAALSAEVPPSVLHRHIQRRAGVQPVLEYTPREYELALAVSAVLLRGMSQKKKRTIGTELAIRELVRNRFCAAGEISVTRANQLLRYLQISPADMRRAGPCVRLQVPHPNFLHEADFTQASFVYLDNLTVRYHSETSHKKPKNRVKVQIGTVVDHYSRCILAIAAYPALAENTEITLKLLHDAWTPKLGTSGLPHGVPWNLYCDQGPGFKSKPVELLAKALFVDITLHSSGNARATGLAENRIKSATTFQHLIKLRLCQGASVNLDQLNVWAQEWIIDENSRPHPQWPKTTRTQVWQQISDDQVRRCPDWRTFMRLSAIGDHPHTVTTYGAVKYQGQEYNVGTPLIRRKVFPYNIPGEGVYVYVPGMDKPLGPLQPGIDHVNWGTYRAPPLTESERRLREVRAMAEKLGYTPDDVEYQRRTDEVFMPREGRPILDDEGKSDRYYSSSLSAKSALADLIDLTRLDPVVIAKIDEVLAARADPVGCIPVEVVDEIMRLVQ